MVLIYCKCMKNPSNKIDLHYLAVWSLFFLTEKKYTKTRLHWWHLVLSSNSYRAGKQPTAVLQCTH